MTFSKAKTSSKCSWNNLNCPSNFWKEKLYIGYCQFFLNFMSEGRRCIWYPKHVQTAQRRCPTGAGPTSWTGQADTPEKLFGIALELENPLSYLQIYFPCRYWNVWCSDWGIWQSFRKTGFKLPAQNKTLLSNGSGKSFWISCLLQRPY